MDQSVLPRDSAEPATEVPVTSGRRRRVVGWLVDYLVVMVPGLAFVAFTAIHVVNSLPGYVGAVAAHAGWARLTQLFTTHGTTAVLREAAGDEWFELVLPLIVGLLAVPVLQFVYHAILVGWRGRTLGMMVVDVTTGTGPERTRPRAGAALGRAMLITLVETGIIAVALTLFVLGQFFLGALAWTAALALFWLDLLVALAPARRTLIDRLTGTVVVRRNLYAAIGQQTAGLTRRASAAAVAASRQTASVAASAGQTLAVAATSAGHAVAEAATSAGLVLVDAAAVTGNIARQGAQHIVHSAPVQGVLESRAGQRAQEIGAAGVERAKELGERAGEHARRLGGRVGQLWQERRAARAGDAAPALDTTPADLSGRQEPPIVE